MRLGSRAAIDRPRARECGFDGVGHVAVDFVAARTDRWPDDRLVRLAIAECVDCRADDSRRDSSPTRVNRDHSRLADEKNGYAVGRLDAQSQIELVCLECVAFATKASCGVDETYTVDLSQMSDSKLRQRRHTKQAAILSSPGPGPADEQESHPSTGPSPHLVTLDEGRFQVLGQKVGCRGGMPHRAI